jgi:hypothetical protein
MSENEDKKQSHAESKPDTEKIRDRARASALEVQRLAIILPTGMLALFFHTLTVEEKPPLTGAQTAFVLCGALAMAVAAGCGMFSWFADSKWNNHWARALSSDGEERSRHYRSRERWKSYDHYSGKLCLVAFSSGIACAMVYMFLRVLTT